MSLGPIRTRRKSLPSRGAWIEIKSQYSVYLLEPSLPSRGAWIEIKSQYSVYLLEPSLPSRGAWIEIVPRLHILNVGRSLPSRGAWIEMCGARSAGPVAVGRSPHGERGLKYPGPRQHGIRGTRRSPHGERGLKSLQLCVGISGLKSLPSRGAWIEMIEEQKRRLIAYWSLPSRGAWIEIGKSVLLY